MLFGSALKICSATRPREAHERDVPACCSLLPPSCLLPPAFARLVSLHGSLHPLSLPLTLSFSLFGLKESALFSDLCRNMCFFFCVFMGLLAISIWHRFASEAVTRRNVIVCTSLTVPSWGEMRITTLWYTQEATLNYVISGLCLSRRRFVHRHGRTLLTRPDSLPWP